VKIVRPLLLHFIDADVRSVRAMYRHHRAAVALAVILLLAWICVTAWLLIHAERAAPPSPAQRHS